MKSQAILSINEFDVQNALDEDVKITKGQLSEIATVMSEEMTNLSEDFWEMFNDCLLTACNKVLYPVEK